MTDVAATDRRSNVRAVNDPAAAGGGARDPMRVRFGEERHATALARELADVAGLDLHRYDGVWEVSVDRPLGDRLVVRVLNAVSTVLAGEPSLTALVLLDGREYQIEGQ